MFRRAWTYISIRTWASATASRTAVACYRLRPELKLSVRNSILRGAEATKAESHADQTNKNYLTKMTKDTPCPHMFRGAWTYISVRTWASATASWTAAASSATAWGQQNSSSVRNSILGGTEAAEARPASTTTRSGSRTTWELKQTCFT